MTNKKVPPIPQKAVQDDWEETMSPTQAAAMLGGQPVAGASFGPTEAMPQYPVGGMQVPPRFTMPQEAIARAQAKPVNPLQKYFRTPGLSIRLPSNGAFTPGQIAFEQNGEVAVFPMTAADEMYLKNPDALMNGSAVERIIQSCVPSIQNVRDLPTADVDAILLAIRAATYGDRMEYEVVCPNCNTENKDSASIREALETAASMESEYVVRLEDDLIAYLKPHTFKNQTVLSLATFEEAKRFQLMESDTELTDEEKQRRMGASIERIGKLNFQLMAECVDKIVTADGEVTDKGFILEFLVNCPRQYTKTLEENLTEINSIGVNKKRSCTCGSCGHTWEAEVSFDPAHFFG